jgi:peptidoglycan/xylan/chitin deacetylase (PgdA/CDA1 family)
VTLETFLRGLRDPTELPERAALITFDDGSRSIHDEALGVLQQMECPAVAFVPTDHVGRANDWDQGVEPGDPLCTWDQLRRIDAAGVRVQSHGASHRTFGALSADEIREEAARSRESIEREVGRRVSTLAYPYGDAGDPSTSRTLAAAGYEAAFLYAGGLVSMPPEDRFRIDRIAVGPDTDLAGLLEGA